MVLAAALALDALLGEPRWLWRRLPHPAVLMGRAVEALERRWNRGRHRRAKGVAAIAFLALLAALAGWALSVHWIPETLLAAVLLAQRSLAEHVAAVAEALRRGLPDGRASVARIVGRDTAGMDEPAVARAAVESAAENLSDGVVAPAFWFAVAGLPGMLLYKMVNTADSTVGYRTARHERFGWASARLDDLLNWVPARLTALLILAVTATAPRGVAGDARLHRSPNAGWPEAAAARALGVSLAGPRAYDGAMQDYPLVNAGAPAPGPAAVEAAVRLLWRVWAALLALGFAGTYSA
ncbi:adenosylcobinamide-phosphate synthase CbiB [Jannaschia sp. W003]|uniref:adenosylcobinamide-phosphate synthase CbiB n=1 Tax=Jannaschia sp. W003 TaxID=2867012 RepID=UPI0021A849E9|nr:adenosylcobinamide-phosphate synthase CbiB [Jannaschia sp. W003]UWQ22550.1 adenosylcobinamide-phosphate synthase CbiB [Jannaschia sp. W003]